MTVTASLFETILRTARVSNAIVSATLSIFGSVAEAGSA